MVHSHHHFHEFDFNNIRSGILEIFGNLDRGNYVSIKLIVIINVQIILINH